MVIWPEVNFLGKPMMCDGQCLMEEVDDLIGNDKAKSGGVTKKFS